MNTTGKYAPSHTEKYWVSDMMKEKEVMIIGKRTLRNGTVTYHSGIGSIFESTGVVHAYLVVKDMNSKPFYIEADL